jgi:hypothetical protein
LPDFEDKMMNSNIKASMMKITAKARMGELALIMAPTKPTTSSTTTG